MDQARFAFHDRPEIPLMRDRLQGVFAPVRDAVRHDPTSQWVKASISGRTRDAVSQAAYERLRRAFPSWDLIADADPEAVARLIHDVTWPMDKAGHLVAAAQRIRRLRGRVDLGFLAGRSRFDAFHWLMRLPGVGAKTAAVVLNFSTLRLPVLVVDTHVLRVLRRCALLPARAGFARGFRLATHVLPDWSAEVLYEFHWHIKTLDQTVCTHARPRCGQCPIAAICAAGRSARAGR